MLTSFQSRPWQQHFTLMAGAFKPFTREALSRTHYSSLIRGTWGMSEYGKVLSSGKTVGDVPVEVMKRCSSKPAHSAATPCQGAPPNYRLGLLEGMQLHSRQAALLNLNWVAHPPQVLLSFLN